MHAQIAEVLSNRLLKRQWPHFIKYSGLTALLTSGEYGIQNFIIVLTHSYKCSTLASPRKHHRCNWNHRSHWTRVPILAHLQVICPTIIYELCRWNHWKWSWHVRSHAAPRRSSRKFSHDPLYSSRLSTASPDCICTSFWSVGTVDGT